MNALIQDFKKNFLPSFDLGSGTSTSTGVSNFNRLKCVGVLNDEISNAEIVAKLESLRDQDTIEYPNTTQARQHLKKLMSK